MLCSLDTNVEAGVYDFTIADHHPTFLFMPQSYLHHTLKTEKLLPRFHTRVNYSQVCTLLQHTMFETLYNDDVQVECDNIICSIRNAIKQSSYIHAHDVCMNHTICPSITQPILALLKKKDYHNRLKLNKCILQG